MRCFLTPLALLGFALLPSQAKTVDLPNEKASIEVPADWTVTPKPVDAAPAMPVIILSASNADETEALNVVLMANAQQIEATNAAFVDGVRKGIERSAPAQGATVEFTSTEPTTLNGVPATLIQYKETIASTKRIVYCRLYEIAGNGKMYSLSVQMTDAAQDAKLQSIPNSFRFATPPELPVGADAVRAGKIGQIIGAIIGVLAAFLTIKWLAKKMSGK